MNKVDQERKQELKELKDHFTSSQVNPLNKRSNV